MISLCDPEVVYAATLEELFKSSDGGDRWQSLGGLPSTVLSTAWIVGIAANPHDVDTAYVATRLDGVFKTRDGGVSWEQIAEGLECGPDSWGVAHTFRCQGKLSFTYDPFLARGGPLWNLPGLANLWHLDSF